MQCVCKQYFVHKIIHCTCKCLIFPKRKRNETKNVNICESCNRSVLETRPKYSDQDKDHSYKTKTIKTSVARYH